MAGRDDGDPNPSHNPNPNHNPNPTHNPNPNPNPYPNQVEMKKTAANGQKPPAPPQAKQGTSKPKRGAAGADKERDGSDGDSSEGERTAAPAAAAAPAGAAPKDLADAAPADSDAPPAVRPSFLSV